MTPKRSTINIFSSLMGKISAMHENFWCNTLGTFINKTGSNKVKPL